MRKREKLMKTVPNAIITVSIILVADIGGDTAPGTARKDAARLRGIKI